MNAVWNRNGATVRDVHKDLNTSRAVAYTTVMTLMNILESKGYLRKRLRDRAYFYTPVRKRQQVLHGMVRDFVERVFDGATHSLRLHLLRDEPLSEQERKELRRIIDS